MKKIVSFVLTVALAVTACFVVTGCGNDAKEELIVGMECAYAPFNWTETTKTSTNVQIFGTNQYAEGYDVQIARRIADALNRELVIKAIEWDGLIPALQSGTIDLVIAGMSPTETRKLDIDFTDSYYTSEHVIVCQKTNAIANESDVADLGGYSIVGQVGTLYESIARSILNNNAQESLYKGTVPEIITDIKAGLVDATVLELPVAQGILASDSTLTMIQFDEGKGFVVADEDKVVSIGIAKGQEDLLNRINEILRGISETERVQIMQDAVNAQ